MKKSKPRVGQKLFRLPVGNRAHGTTPTLLPVVVTRVGRKFFTVAQEGRFAIETEHHLDSDSWRQKSDSAPNYALYEHAQQWEDEKERAALGQRIFLAFRVGGSADKFTLPALRAAVSALWPEQGAAAGSPVQG